jgi:hypothetical protein
MLKIKTQTEIETRIQSLKNKDVIIAMNDSTNLSFVSSKVVLI